MSSRQRHNRVANSSFTSPSDIKYHGLWNQGSTCYLNSVLQVLFMTEDFREAVERHTCNNPECMDCHLKFLFDDLNEDTAHTKKMTKRLGINNVHEQRDAAEYFEKILTLTSDKASQIFHGQLTHETKCSKGHTTNADGSFWHLPLELVDSQNKVSKVVSGTEKFFEESYFTGENQMYCDDCDAKCDASMKCVIKHHPDVLTLLLKRFNFDYRYMSYVKNNSPADVPYTLHISKGQTYELYAVVDHCGELRSGHYTATIKSQDDEQWYKFNDEAVRLAKNQLFQVKDTERLHSAYLLFYRKQKRTATMPVITNHNDRCQDPEKMSMREKSKKTRGEGNEAISIGNEQTSDKHRIKPKLKRQYGEEEGYGKNEIKRFHSTEIQHEEQCDFKGHKEQKRGDDEPAPRSPGREHRSSQHVEHLPPTQKIPQQKPERESNNTGRNANVNVVKDVKGRQNTGHAQGNQSQHFSHREIRGGRGRPTEKERGSHVENTRPRQESNNTDRNTNVNVVEDVKNAQDVESQRFSHREERGGRVRPTEKERGIRVENTRQVQVYSPTKANTGPVRVTVEGGNSQSQRHSDTKNKRRETAEKQAHSRRSAERKSDDEIVTLKSLSPSPEFETRGEYYTKVRRVSRERKSTCIPWCVPVPAKRNRHKKSKQNKMFERFLRLFRLQKIMSKK